MFLYLMRHGDAEYPSGSGSDSQRHLTDWGKLQVASMAEVMRRANHVPDRIISSPYLRAMETAAIVAHALGISDRLGTSRHLIPSVNREDMLAEISDHGRGETLMLIGHMPSMGDLAGSLIAQGCALEMPTSAIAAIRLDSFHAELHGTLMWYVSPEIIKP